MAEDLCIWRFPDYASSGMCGRREVFVRPEGKPDGSAIDIEGCLWNAEFGGGRVVRYRPDGSPCAIIRAPFRAACHATSLPCTDRPTYCANGPSTGVAGAPEAPWGVGGPLSRSPWRRA